MYTSDSTSGYNNMKELTKCSLKEQKGQIVEQQ